MLLLLGPHFSVSEKMRANAFVYKRATYVFLVSYESCAGRLP